MYLIILRYNICTSIQEANGDVVMIDHMDLRTCSRRRERLSTLDSVGVFCSQAIAIGRILAQLVVETLSLNSNNNNWKRIFSMSNSLRMLLLLGAIIAFF